MANFQSGMKLPLVSDILTMPVMVGRQVAIFSFNIGVLIWSSLQLLFFTPIIYLLISLYVSDLKLVNFGVFVFFQMVLWGACERLSHFGYLV